METEERSHPTRPAEGGGGVMGIIMVVMGRHVMGVMEERHESSMTASRHGRLAAVIGCALLCEAWQGGLERKGRLGEPWEPNKVLVYVRIQKTGSKTLVHLLESSPPWLIPVAERSVRAGAPRLWRWQGQQF